MKLKLSRLSIALMLGLAATGAHAQNVTLTGAYSQDFDTLSNTAGSTTNTALPTGWLLTETGGGARDNEQYAVDTGSSNTGDTYSYGAAGSTDRALGGLRSGTLQSVIGACFTNVTGSTITSLAVQYTGEQWRLGTAARTDQLDFQYSLDATSLVTGTWVDVNALDFATPNTAGTAGARDGNAAGNRTAISSTLSSISIANGAVICVRWNDSDASGADDGLAIDDFSLTPNVSSSLPTLTVNDVDVVEGNAGTTTATFTVSLSAPAGPGGVTFDIATADNTATIANNDYVGTSLTAQTIPAGSSTYAFSVTINGDTTNEPNESYFVNITNVTGAIAGDVQGIGSIQNDDFTITPIAQIQGNGAVSPFNGQMVITEGVVTALKFNNGFFLQTPDNEVDADSGTSEGIFVFTSTAPPAAAAVGNRVRVSATVTEFTPGTDLNQLPITELINATITPLSTGNALPAPVSLTAAEANASATPDTLERYEGMRVNVAEATVVEGSDGNITESSANSSTTGVFQVVLAGVSRPYREPGIGVLDIMPIPPGKTPPFFDTNQERLMVRSRGQVGAAPLALDAGATITDMTGVLDYYGGTWALLPDVGSGTASGGRTPTAVADPIAQDVTIGGFNLLRFFDEINDSNGAPTITAAALDKRLTKTSIAICDFIKAPDILGVVEVENLRVLGLLADRINSTCARAPSYVPYLVQGNDPGGINVGFLVSTRDAGDTTPAPRVEVLEVTQFGKNTLFNNPNSSTALLNDRPPLMLRAVVNAADGTSYPATVIVNHLRSLNGIDDTAPGSSGWATEGDRVRNKRAQQAVFLADLVETRQQANPEENIVLVGDFNAFEFNDGYTDVMGIVRGDQVPAEQVLTWVESPITTPLLDGSEFIAAPAERYSYVFEGSAQTLDHVVVNEALVMDPGTTAVTIEHARINADFGVHNFGVAGNAIRTSDHDPVRLTIRRAADTSGPAISYTLDPASPNGDNGWYTGNVLVEWTVIDPETTITSSTGCDDATVSSDTASTTFTCTATSAGGTSSVTTVAIKRDATAPTLAPTAPSPLLRGQSYSASANASDATSGVASSSCGALDTSTTGNKSTTCTATDNAGNVATVTLNYTVSTTCSNDGYKGTQLTWCQNICENGLTGQARDTWIHRWVNKYRDLPYCMVNPQPQPTLQ